jgi:hypothetical protein
MSWTRLPYDVCSHEYQIAQSMSPGAYYLTTPSTSCMPCHSDDPHIRLQSQGVSISKNTPLIDIDSELIGITRNLSKCPERQYIPGVCSPNAKLCVDAVNVYNFKDCFPKIEDSRFSAPPSTLRCTGWNRWEWLWTDPQYAVQIPFDHQIDSIQLAKDNHRPCLPRMTDPYKVWPTPSNNPVVSEQYLPVARPPRQELGANCNLQSTVASYFGSCPSTSQFP